MGVDLVNGQHYLALNWSWWGYCLDVAQAFGWQPAGILSWESSYFRNNYQAVTDSDAHALAAALDKAIAAHKGERAMDEKWQVSALLDSYGQERQRQDMAKLDALFSQGVALGKMTEAKKQETLEDARKGSTSTPAMRLAALSALADFARRGSFLIG